MRRFADVYRTPRLVPERLYRRYYPGLARLLGPTVSSQAALDKLVADVVARVCRMPAQLTVEQALTVVLAYRLGLGAAQIARVTECSVATVSQRMLDARGCRA